MVKPNRMTLFLFIFLFLSIFLTGIAWAGYADDQQQFIKNITSEEGMDLAKWVAGPNTTIDVLVQGLSARLVGSINSNGEATTVGLSNFLFAGMSNLYQNPPASSVFYAKSVINNIGLSRTYAASSFGFEAIEPVIGLWKIFRNLCYLFFVVIFIIFGFMILFRTRINPQTVIAIENSLPKIIVGLLLITFSYAIIGLLIDLSTVITTLFIGLFFDPFLNKGAIGSIVDFSENIAKNSNIFNLAGVFVSSAVVNGITDAITNSLTVSFAGIDAGSTLVIASAKIFGLIFAIAAISATFRTFFGLLSAYVNIIISTIFSPFMLLGGVLPISSQGFGSWIKNLLTNVLVFPITFIMLLMAAVIERFGEPALNGAGQPNLSPKPWETLVPGQESLLFKWSPIPFGIYGGSIISKLIAFGIVLMLPSVPGMIKEAFQIRGGGGPSPFEGIKGVASKIPIIGQLMG